MTPSQAFGKAHALTRRTVRPGDSYSATFALCLRYVYAQKATTEDRAERLEDLLGANGFYSNQWGNRHEIRVYVKRYHGPGRLQELGHIAIDRKTGAVREEMKNRRVFLCKLAA